MGDGSRHRNDEPADTDALIEALRDERARRFYAEQQEAEAREKAATWRRRAEERAERIKRLRARQGWRGLLRSRSGGGETVAKLGGVPGARLPAPAAAVDEFDGSPSTYPTVRAGVLATDGILDAVAGQLDRFDAATATEESLITADLWLLRSSDLVANPDVLARVGRGLTVPARPRVVVEVDAGEAVRPELADLLNAADLVVSSKVVSEIPGQAITVVEPCFDARLNRPHLPAAGNGLIAFETAPLTVLGDPPVCGIWSGPVDGPVPVQVLALAARGVPVLVEGTGTGSWPVLPAGERDPTGEAEVLAADPDALARASVRVRRAAHRHHVTDVRAHELVTAAGILVAAPWPRVAALLVSNRPHDLSSALTGLAATTYPRVHLVLGMHGFRPSADLERMIEEVAPRFEKVTAVSLDSALTLGACLNEAADSTGAAILAKIDDDDAYGPGYLDDQVQALRYSGADVVGKLTQYVYLEEDDTTYLIQPGSEERFTTYVPGPTLVFRRSMWEAVPFPQRRQRVDSIFVRGVNTLGGQIYSTSRMEFMLVRRSGGHTWESPPERWRSRGEPVWEGKDPRRTWA